VFDRRSQVFFSGKKKTFNMAAKRAKAIAATLQTGDIDIIKSAQREAAREKRNGKSASAKAKRSKWRQQSADFQQAMRAGREPLPPRAPSSSMRQAPMRR